MKLYELVLEVYTDGEFGYDKAKFETHRNNCYLFTSMQDALHALITHVESVINTFRGNKHYVKDWYSKLLVELNDNLFYSYLRYIDDMNENLTIEADLGNSSVTYMIRLLEDVPISDCNDSMKSEIFNDAINQFESALLSEAVIDKSVVRRLSNQLKK